MARDFQTRLARRGARSGLALSAPLVNQLSAYYELLSRWNRKINLTALEDPDQAIDRLLLEPLLAVRHLPAGIIRLMDVGSGGGSPAIPLKLALPAVDLTMVEAKARKSAFLREAVRSLGLDHAHVETARYEELLLRPELHESFDAVSMRAVRVETRVLLTLQAFLKPGGHVILFRGPSGPHILALVPPLEWQSTHPLVESLQSRLSLLSKQRVG